MDPGMDGPISGSWHWNSSASIHGWNGIWMISSVIKVSDKNKNEQRQVRTEWQASFSVVSFVPPWFPLASCFLHEHDSLHHIYVPWLQSTINPGDEQGTLNLNQDVSNTWAALFRHLSSTFSKHALSDKSPCPVLYWNWKNISQLTGIWKDDLYMQTLNQDIKRPYILSLYTFCSVKRPS